MEVRLYDRKNVGSSSFLFFSGVDLPIDIDHIHHCIAVGECDLAHMHKPERWLAIDLSNQGAILTVDLYGTDGTAMVQVDLRGVPRGDKKAFIEEKIFKLLKVFDKHDKKSPRQQELEQLTVIREGAVLTSV